MYQCFVHVHNYIDLGYAQYYSPTPGRPLTALLPFCSAVAGLDREHMYIESCDGGIAIHVILVTCHNIIVLQPIYTSTYSISKKCKIVTYMPITSPVRSGGATIEIESGTTLCFKELILVQN